jgi:Na+-transporting NADH:ubiquinone oxidoreductase subunit C
MAINKNSNLYTVLYTVVMVVIVGALLATVATALQPFQEANVLNEQKSSIMKAFGDENGDFAKVKVYVLGENGARLELTSDADIKKVFELISNRKDLAAADLESGLPYFEYDEKIVIPIVGKGLWGDIWGYIAIKDGKVAGIVMDHAGETPGLGAEIATEGVQKKFVGKSLYNGSEFALRMQKGGAKEGMEDFQVDAITGGTKTCDGVNAMLENSLTKYESLF